VYERASQRAGHSGVRQFGAGLPGNSGLIGTLEPRGRQLSSRVERRGRRRLAVGKFGLGRKFGVGRKPVGVHPKPEHQPEPQRQP
jgi:hypothetical protein